MIEDRFTNTEADAGAYEARRGADTHNDRPSLSDLIDDDATDSYLFALADAEATAHADATYTEHECTSLCDHRDDDAPYL